MTPLAGFLPDVDTATPGAIIAATNVIPYAAGMRGAPVPVAVQGVPVLAAVCRNAAVATLLSGVRRVFAGTAAKLYELVAGAWVDVSRGGSYTLGSDDRWDFVQFGNATLAVNKSTTLQRSNGAGAFADVAGAPKAAVIEAAGGFVIAFNLDDPVYGDSPDRWRCCAINDETSWTASLSTQANTGRLVSYPGAITAAKTFGDQLVVFKDRAIYIGRYVGAPATWQFDAIPGDIGCVGSDAVADIGPALVFVGRADIFYFDGTRPVSIAEGQLRQWFFANVSQAYLYKTTLVHDKQNNVVWFFYPGLSSTGDLDSALVYHLGRKTWGVATVTIEAACNYVSAGLVFDTLPGTFNTLPAVSFDSQYFVSGGRVTTVFTSAHQMASLSGAAASSSMTLFDAGDDLTYSYLSRVLVAYQYAPASATAAGFVKGSRGEVTQTGGTGTYSAGKFDLRQSGRFHRVKIDAVGDWGASGVDLKLSASGQR